MQVVIMGSYSPYSFLHTVRILETDTDNGNSFTEMEVKLSHIKADLKGNKTEQVIVSFNDYSVIQDLNGNNMTKQSANDYLNSYDYLSESEKIAADAGGNSLKFSLISVFSLNLILKMALSISTSMLWSLIHVLQAFRFILLINIRMPGILKELMKYLAVIVGDIEELKALTPNIVAEYIIDTSKISDNPFVYQKFVDNSYETPFVIENVGDKLTLMVFIII